MPFSGRLRTGHACWKRSMARDEVGSDPLLSSESALRPVSMVP